MTHDDEAQHHAEGDARLSRSLDLPADEELPDWLKRLDTKLRNVVVACRTPVTNTLAFTIR